MGIPVDAHVRQAFIGPEHGDKWYAGFDQPAGLKHRLAVGVPAIAISEARVFSREVECFDGVSAGQQVICAVVVAGEGVDLGGGFECAGLIVD